MPSERRARLGIRVVLLGVGLAAGSLAPGRTTAAQSPDTTAKSLDQEAAALLQRGDTAGALSGFDAASNKYYAHGELRAGLQASFRALELTRARRSPADEATTLNNIGLFYDALGHRDSALVYYGLALPLRLQVRNPVGLARTLGNIGLTYAHLGRPDSALAYYRAMLEVSRKAGYAAGEGTALNNIGSTFDDLGHADSALSYYARALPLRRAAGDRAAEGVTLHNIGRAQYRLGRVDSALSYLAQALELERAVGDRLTEATTLTSLGAIHHDLGHSDSALAYDRQGIRLARLVGDRDGEATAINNLASVHSDLGNLDSALALYRQAVRLKGEVGDRAGEGVALDNLGGVFGLKGRPDSALAYYHQALQRAREVADPAAEATTLNNIGLFYGNMGRRDSALVYTRRALILYRGAADRAGEAVALHNIGRALDVDHRDSALTYYRQALALFHALGIRRSEGTVLHNIAHAYNGLGQLDSALAYYRQSLELARAVHNTAGEAATLANIGMIQLGRGQPDSALAYYGQALWMQHGVGLPASEAVTLKNLGVVYASLGRRALAIAHGKRALVLVESIRARVATISPVLERSYVESTTGTYRWLADQLVAAGRYAEAEVVVRLLKRGELQDLVRSGPLSGSDALPLSADETAAVTEVDARLGAVVDALRCSDAAPAPTSGGCAGREATLGAARAAFQQTLDSVATALDHKDAGAAAQVAFARATEAAAARWKSRLGTRTALLQTIVADSSLSVLLTLPEVRLAHRVPLPRDSVRALVFRFRTVLLDPSQDPRPAAKALYELLVAPFDSVLKVAPVTTLVWALDDVLRYIPLAALYDGRRYLVERYETVVLTLAALESLAEPRPHALAVTAFGTSRAVGGFPALPSVRAELAGIVGTGTRAGQGHLPGRILLDSAFTLASWDAALRRPTAVLHVASHFRFQPGDADNTFLLLGSGEHFSLKALQLAGPTLTGVDVLALSACETALGGQLGDAAGAEVEGFGAIAQQKGVRTVLATLWQVNDPSIAALMQGFYRALALGQRKGASLRAAQLALLRGTVAGPVRAGRRSGAGNAAGGPTQAVAGSKWAHPYYWAPAILMGNWN